MSAPDRLILNVGGKKVSAFMLPSSSIEEAANIVCKACAPVKTRLKLVVELAFPNKHGNQHFAVFQCSGCSRQWAVPYTTAQQPKETE